jgi:pSer/pThr/pTyr-binding forkhead associated (FHA) protein
MKARLTMCEDGRHSSAFPLSQALTSIGRDAGNLVQLTHPEVSKRHAVIRLEKNGWTVEDLNSTNGVIVNGLRASRSVLKNGDRIRVGPFELLFETLPDDSEWVPTHVIDMSTKVNQLTMVQDLDPRRNRPKPVR